MLFNNSIDGSVLAMAFSSPTVSAHCLFATGDVAKEGRSRDLRTIWEAFNQETGAWCLDIGQEWFHKTQREEGWEALKLHFD